MAFFSELFRISQWASCIAFDTARRLARPSLSYRPLTQPSEIRLLHLRLEVNQDSEIVGELRHVLLDSNPEYYALSYVWGKQMNNDPEINLNGRKLRVTWNLYQALLQLRNEPLVIWIDAICIDQNNLAERAEQVMLMRRIFGQAALTIAWLGRSNKTVFQAFRYIDKITKLIRYWRVEVSPEKLTNEEDAYANVERFADWYLDEWLHEGDKKKRNVANKIQALEYLLSYDWFSRVWIKQEVALSQAIKFVCGQLILEWGAFEQVLLLLQFSRLGLFAVSHINVYQAYMLIWARSGVPEHDISEIPDGFQLLHSDLGTMLQWVSTYRNCGATDPRDKVFALAALGTDGDHQDFLPDYYPTSTFQLLYIRFASHYLRSLENLGILVHAGATHAWHDFNDVLHDPLLPSWVPDWSQARGTTALEPGFTAAGDTSAAYRLSADDRCLTVRGRIVDDIVLVGDDLRLLSLGRLVQHQHSDVRGYLDGRYVFEWLEFFRLFRDYVVNFQRYVYAYLAGKRSYWTGQDLEEAYLRTLFCDRCVDRQSPQTYGSTAFNFELATKVRNMIAEGDEPSKVKGWWLDANTAIGTVIVLAQGRKWFISAKGYIGWVPLAAKVGDRLAIIDGLGCPYTLRRVGLDNYNFIGDSYVHGFMDNEAVRDPKFVPQDIHLW